MLAVANSMVGYPRPSTSSESIVSIVAGVSRAVSPSRLEVGVSCSRTRSFDAVTVIVVSSLWSEGAWAAVAARGTRAPVATSRAMDDFIVKDSVAREGRCTKGARVGTNVSRPAH